ncbi:uncharacterized protein LOC134295914 [Anolis carolinensis]|uniref:uncharacterized protein LOC134295914 n=1 Tax=Anolis carolinensis TaxID=28377 RepID=UPI002F2B4AFB
MVLSDPARDERKQHLVLRDQGAWEGRSGTPSPACLPACLGLGRSSPSSPASPTGGDVLREPSADQSAAASGSSLAGGTALPGWGRRARRSQEEPAVLSLSIDPSLSSLASLPSTKGIGRAAAPLEGLLPAVLLLLPLLLLLQGENNEGGRGARRLPGALYTNRGGVRLSEAQLRTLAASSAAAASAPIPPHSRRLLWAKRTGGPRTPHPALSLVHLRGDAVEEEGEEEEEEEERFGGKGSPSPGAKRGRPRRKERRRITSQSPKVQNLTIVGFKSERWALPQAWKRSGFPA